MAKQKTNKLSRYAPYIVVGLFLLIGVIALIVAPMFTNQPVSCTEEALMCPDGTAVGRTGPQCKFSACPPLSPFKPVVLSTGSMGSSTMKIERLAISDFSLKEVFAALPATQDMSIPTVNWSKEVVVGVGMGSKPTGGYSVSFEKYDIDPVTGKYRFYVTETLPGKNCMTTESITYPYQIAKFQIAVSDVTRKGYQFIYKEETLDCLNNY